jgi:hypothetical protein
MVLVGSENLLQTSKDTNMLQHREVIHKNGLCFYV